MLYRRGVLCDIAIAYKKVSCAAGQNNGFRRPAESMPGKKAKGGEQGRSASCWFIPDTEEESLPVFQPETDYVEDILAQCSFLSITWWDFDSTG
jgi:hypothetical protein